MDQTFEDLFVNQVSIPLTHFITNVKQTKVAIIPSLRDVQHDCYVFPQPPFSNPKSVLGLDDEVRTFN
jgi:hypothetical protein